MELGDRELVFEAPQCNDLDPFIKAEEKSKLDQKQWSKFFQDKYDQVMSHPIDDIIKASIIKARRSTMIVELDFESQRFRIIKVRYPFNSKKVLVYLDDEDLHRR